MEGSTSTAVMGGGSVESLESDWAHQALSPIRRQKIFFWLFFLFFSFFSFFVDFSLSVLESLPLEEREMERKREAEFSLLNVL